MTAKGVDEWRSIFERLGFPDPGAAVRAELEEENAHLAQHLFLRLAWRAVVAEDDTSWIDHHRDRAARHPNAPLAGAGLALERLLAAGADPRDLTDVVRGLQYETLFDVCDVLDSRHHHLEEEFGPELAEELFDAGWTLIEIDQEGRHGREFGMLHEGVLSMDPTRREMRPRPGPDALA
ncbi:MAG: hypothetical protein ACRDH8_04750 [Actinomycetota bacterium]